MKKLVLIFFLGCCSNYVKAQVDSVAVSLEPTGYEFLHDEFFDFSPQLTFKPVSSDFSKLNLKLNQNSPFSVLKSFNLMSHYIAGVNGVWHLNPLISAYKLNNAAVYSLNGKWKVAGSSFSANSVFNPMPVKNFDSQKMDLQGVNLYLEYKVSDKFRIGGGIQINHQGY